MAVLGIILPSRRAAVDAALADQRCADRSGHRRSISSGCEIWPIEFYFVPVCCHGGGLGSLSFLALGVCGVAMPCRKRSGRSVSSLSNAGSRATAMLSITRLGTQIAWRHQMGALAVGSQVATAGRGVLTFRCAGSWPGFLVTSTRFRWRYDQRDS